MLRSSAYPKSGLARSSRLPQPRRPDRAPVACRQSVEADIPGAHHGVSPNQARKSRLRFLLNVPLRPLRQYLCLTSRHVSVRERGVLWRSKDRRPLGRAVLGYIKLSTDEAAPIRAVSMKRAASTAIG